MTIIYLNVPQLRVSSKSPLALHQGQTRTQKAIVKTDLTNFYLLIQLTALYAINLHTYLTVRKA